MSARRNARALSRAEEPLVAEEVDGRLWSVGGVPLVVPDGIDGPALVLAQVGALLTGPGPWTVAVRYSGMAFGLVVSPDGSVDAVPGTVLDAHVLYWVRPAGSVPVLPSAQPALSPLPPVPLTELLPAHPGSGASTWAQLLGFREISLQSRSTPAPWVILRSTIAGVEAAKSYTSAASGLLVVADAAGKVPAPVARAIRVLEGAAPVVRVPWVPALRGMNVVPEGPAVTKAVAKVAAAVEKYRRY